MKEERERERGGRKRKKLKMKWLQNTIKREEKYERVVRGGRRGGRGGGREEKMNNKKVCLDNYLNGFELARRIDNRF